MPCYLCPCPAAGHPRVAGPWVPRSGPTSSPARTSLQQLQSHSHPQPHPAATPLPGKRASPVTTALIKAQEDASCWKTRVKACSSRHHHRATSSPHHDHVAPVVLGEGERGGGGSCLYPGSPLLLARWARGRVLGRPPTNRGLNGTPSPLPGECPDGAVPMSLSPGERQTDRQRGEEQGESKSRARGHPCHRPAACHRERGPQSISRACGGTVKGHVWVSHLCQSLGTFSLRGGSSSPSRCIPSPPSPTPYQDPASPQPQHPHGPAAGGRGWATGRAARVRRHPPPGVAAAGWTPAACPCPSGCFAAHWASCSPSSWHPRKPHTPPRC